MKHIQKGTFKKCQLEMSAKGVRHSWRRAGCVLTPVLELTTGLTSQSGQTLQCPLAYGGHSVSDPPRAGVTAT